MEIKKTSKWLTPLVLGSALLLSACSSDSSSTSGSSGGDSSKPIKLTLNSNFGAPTKEEDPKWNATFKFEELIEERTDGRVDIELFHSQQLVSQDQALEAVANGTVDMVLTAAYYGAEIPEQDFLFLPFGIQGEDHALHLLRETEIGELFEKPLEEKGIKPIMYYPASHQAIISIDKPIRKMEDFKGLSVAPGTGFWTKWFEGAGAGVANVPAAEMYEGLSRGIVDATVYGFTGLPLLKFYEVAKHVTLPGISYPSIQTTHMNMDKWNSLPEDIQQIITDTALELEKEAFQKSIDITDSLIQTAEENGMTVHHLTDEEIQAFRDSAQVAWDEFASRNENTKRMIEIIEKDLETWGK